MKKIWILCFVMPLLFACATPKDSSFKEDLSAKVDETEEWKSDLQKSIDYYAQQTVKEVQDKMSELQISWNRTNYSAPDSTGKQHPTSTETGTANNKTKEVVDKTQESSMQYNEVKQLLVELERKMDAYIEQNQKVEEKTEPPWWHKGLMVLGIISLILISYKIGKTKRP